MDQDSPVRERALVVDDDPEALEAAAGLLEKAGYLVERSDSGFKAVELVGKESYDIVISDLVMRGVSGFEVIREAVRADPDAVCSASSWWRPC